MDDTKDNGCTCPNCVAARNAAARVAGSGKPNISDGTDLLKALEALARPLSSLKAKPSDTPSFAAVAQPGLAWAERGTDQNFGATDFSVDDGNGGTVAMMVTPNADTPIGRATKLHELMHARFTPEIMETADALLDKGMTEMVKQIAEDVRLAQIGDALGIHEQLEAYFTKDIFDGKLKAFTPQDGVPFPAEAEKACQEKIATLYMACYGHKIEGGANSRDIGWFETATGGKLSRKSKRVLKAWSRQVDAVGKDGAATDGEEACKQFEAIARATSKAFALITGEQDKMEPPPQPSQSQGGQGGGDGDKKEDGGSSGEDQEGKKSEPDDGGKDAKPDAGKDSEPNNKKQDDKKDQKGSGGDGKKETKPSSPSAGQSTGKSTPGQGSDTPFMKEWVPAALERQRVEWQKAKDGKGTGTTAAKSKGLAGKAPVLPGLLRNQTHAEQMEQFPNGVPYHIKNYALEEGPGIWGTMVTVLAPLERNFKASTRRLGAAAPEGPIPKHMSRWFSDKHLFNRPGRRPGGTLLIDISGSMSWADADTRALIEMVPAMTIALYSSSASGRGIGRLTIIARHGRCVNKDYNFRQGHAGDNLIDGPALAWLCKQPKPRVWYSDGGVTGHGGSAEDLKQDARRLMTLGGIRRTVELKRVKEILSGRALPGVNLRLDD